MSKKAPSSAKSHDEQLAKDLWEFSEKAVGEKVGDLSS